MQKVKIILILLCFVEPCFAKVCQKKIITANMTDMKTELKKYKKQGWKTTGKLQFIEYSWQQKVVKKCG